MNSVFTCISAITHFILLFFVRSDAFSHVGLSHRIMISFWDRSSFMLCTRFYHVLLCNVFMSIYLYYLLSMSYLLVWHFTWVTFFHWKSSHDQYFWCYSMTLQITSEVLLESWVVRLRIPSSSVLMSWCSLSLWTDLMIIHQFKTSFPLLYFEMH